MTGASQTALPLAPTSDLAGWIKLGNVRVASRQLRTTVLFNCGTRARKLQSVGSRGIWNSSGRTDSGCFALRPRCFIPLSLNLTFSYIRPWTILRFYNALHCAACPLAVQTSPYFLFNSFASRKSDSNTSPRKHKYASLGTAFHIVPALRRNSDLKWGFPESINRLLLPPLCLA